MAGPLAAVGSATQERQQEQCSFAVSSTSGLTQNLSILKLVVQEIAMHLKQGKKLPQKTIKRIAKYAKLLALISDVARGTMGQLYSAKRGALDRNVPEL